MAFEFCPYCGKKLKSDFKFCPFCGEKIYEDEQLLKELKIEEMTIEELTLAAENGNAQAQNALGYRYEYGDGVKEDYGEALKWYKLSAENGYLDGQFHLGRMYYYGYRVDQDYGTAIKWYRLAAEQGCVNAICNLAYCYAEGRGVDKDIDKATELYLRAAKAGNYAAEKALRDNLEYSAKPSVKQFLDKRRGEKPVYSDVKIAAKNGDVEAQIELGHRYASGNGFKVNPLTAFRWFSKAAAEGNPEGQYYLAECYERHAAFDENGNPLGDDCYGGIMRNLYSKSAEQGFPLAINCCQADAEFNKKFQDIFVDLCNKLSKYPKEELDAFLNDYEE